MRFLILAAGVALAGCNPPAPQNQTANAAAPEPAANETALPNETAAIGNESAPVAGPLAGYVGKYPFDKVDGKTFLEQSLVRSAVEGAVGDAAIREWIFRKAGPQAPIAVVEGRLAAWGCETHNCGPHQWTVLMAPDGHDAQVCYRPDGADKPDWYAGGAKIARTDPCPSGE